MMTLPNKFPKQILDYIANQKLATNYWFSKRPGENIDKTQSQGTPLYKLLTDPKNKHFKNVWETEFHLLRRRSRSCLSRIQLAGNNSWEEMDLERAIEREPGRSRAKTRLFYFQAFSSFHSRVFL